MERIHCVCIGVTVTHPHSALPGIHSDFALEPPRSDLFLFPDESGNLSQEPSPTFPVYHTPLIYTPASEPAPDSDDFCILETPGSGAAVRPLACPCLA